MDYLYFLQGLREACPSAINMIFVLISEFVVSVGVLIPAIIYWCYDKRTGRRMLFGIGAAKSLADTLKMFLCINRPWILDSRLHLASEVEGTATGYSTPSGHTTMGTALYGSLAVWKKEKKGFAILCGVMILLTAFSRNWLGAHTPQDVTLAIILSAVVLFATYKVCDWVEAKAGRDLIALIAVLVVCIVAAVVVICKPYPLEYLADGSLLVDPVEMSRDCFEAMGILAGWAIGCFIERRWIKFEPTDDKRAKIIRIVVGAALVFLFNKVLVKAAVSMLDPRLGKFLRTFVTMLVGAAGWPCVFKLIEGKRK